MNELWSAWAPALLCRVKPGGTEGPAVQTMSQVGFGIAARRELTRDNHSWFQKAGAWITRGSREDCVGEKSPCAPKGGNLLLCLASWLPRKPTMKAAEGTVPRRCLPASLITVPGKVKFT